MKKKRCTFFHFLPPYPNFATWVACLKSGQGELLVKHHKFAMKLGPGAHPLDDVLACLGAFPASFYGSLGKTQWIGLHEVWIWQHCKINSHSPTMGASGRPQPPKPDSMGGRSGPIAPVGNWCTHHQPTVARRWQKSAFWPNLPRQGLKLATWLPPMAPNGAGRQQQ